MENAARWLAIVVGLLPLFPSLSLADTENVRKPTFRRVGQVAAADAEPPAGGPVIKVGDPPVGPIIRVGDAPPPGTKPAIRANDQPAKKPAARKADKPVAEEPTTTDDEPPAPAAKKPLAPKTEKPAGPVIRAGDRAGRPLIRAGDGGGGGPVVYKNSQDHYSITLPPGWKIVSKAEVDAAMSQMNRQFGLPKVDFIVGFQRTDRAAFGYPYVLINRFPVATPSIDHIMKSLEDEGRAAFDNVAAQTKPIATGTSMGRPTVDRKRSMFFIPMEANMNGIGPVKGLSAGVLGKEGVAQMSFYATANEYDLYEPEFQMMLDEFKWDPGLEYDEEKAKANDHPRFNWDKAWEGGLNGGLKGAGIGLIIAIAVGLLKALAGGGRHR